MARNKAVPHVHIDNERVRVTEWRFTPDSEVGQHRHEYDYVVVPIMNGTLLAYDSQGESKNELVRGRPYFRKAGVEHNVVNGNFGNFAFIEVELK